MSLRYPDVALTPVGKVGEGGRVQAGLCRCRGAWAAVPSWHRLVPAASPASASVWNGYIMEAEMKPAIRPLACKRGRQRGRGERAGLLSATGAFVHAARSTQHPPAAPHQERPVLAPSVLRGRHGQRERRVPCLWEQGPQGGLLPDQVCGWGGGWTGMGARPEGCCSRRVTPNWHSSALGPSQASAPPRTLQREGFVGQGGGQRVYVMILKRQLAAVARHHLRRQAARRGSRRQAGRRARAVAHAAATGLKPWHLPPRSLLPFQPGTQPSRPAAPPSASPPPLPPPCRH